MRRGLLVIVHSVRNSSAARVRAAMRPGMAATKLASTKTKAPRATTTISWAGTVGLGTT
jgi:hypothetical protein